MPGCQHGLLGETAFAIEAPAIVFGRGALREVGEHAVRLGMKRVALFTEPHVAVHAEAARAALASEGVDVATFDAVEIEPTDRSFGDAAAFARDGRFDGYVSVGGGSVIDTAKAAALYARYPAPFAAYVNRPLGEGRALPGPLPPHIACPTTSGTGAECTGIAVFDWLEHRAKTGIAARGLRPSLAVVDPDTTRTLPSSVVAASGFDVICHAIESYTARPFDRRPRGKAIARPMSQGANPHSDVGSLEALRLAGRYFTRAVADATDDEARGGMMWAAALAGIAFGNAGVHVPHGMSYAVAGLVRDYQLRDYPESMVPHGLSVVLNAPSVFALTYTACPDRHLVAAEALGAEITDRDARVLPTRLLDLMRATSMPTDLAAVGYTTADLEALTDRAMLQTRLLDNAPLPIERDVMLGLFASALEVR